MHVPDSGLFWYPFAPWGITASWSGVDLLLLSRALIVAGIILLLCLCLRWVYSQQNPEQSPWFTLSWLGFEQIYHMVLQSLPTAATHHHSFIAFLFLFLLLSNWLVLFGLEEPTADYNMTLALALFSFIWVQKQAISAHGIIGYIKEYIKIPFSFTPITPFRVVFVWPLLLLGNMIVGMISFPLELVGKFSQILSLSFRLFGNIKAGSVIAHLSSQFTSSYIFGGLLGLAGLNLIVLGFFGIFEGLIQAFVFTMLVTTYLGIGASK